MISYDVTKKYFIEDFNKVGKDLNLDFCHGKDLDIEKMKKAILEKLAPDEKDLNRNENKIKVLNKFCGNLNEFYQLKNIYNEIYIYKDEYTINNSIEKKENKNKDISKLEFDLMLKKVSGKKIINCLDEMNKKNRLIIFIRKKELKEASKYNICIEITVDSADIISKKIPQIYKTISCMNFLYKTNNDFRESNKSTSDISESYGYFKNKTDFINYDLDLIIMTISNGKLEIFRNN